MRALLPALVCVLAPALAGCTLITDSFLVNEFSGDTYPIQVDRTSGAVILGLQQPTGQERTALLDLLSPITVVDPGPGADPSVTTSDLLVLGERGPGGPLDLPRAKLSEAQLVSVHPCSEDEDPCVVGATGMPRGYDAMIGADSLAGDAVRLRLGADQVFVLADVAGDETQRTLACDGVFPSPFVGGGTLVIGGTELPFGGRRIAVDTCLGAVPDPKVPQGERGTDALLVVSTGVGISLLGESAYARYVLGHPGAPPFDTLPEEGVNLPSGPVLGRRGMIPNLALVASSSSSPRSACRQVYASHFLTARDCLPEDDCPCEGEIFCGTAAVTELAPATGISVLVIPDADPTLQALRTELRPDQPEVDGILGADALLTAELDVDYPHDRVLSRCTADGCVTRPELVGHHTRVQAQGCLQYAPPDPNF